MQNKYLHFFGDVFQNVNAINFGVHFSRLLHRELQLQRCSFLLNSHT